MADGGEEVLDRDVKDFVFRQLCRVRIHRSPSSLPTGRSQLLAISSRFGLTFVAVDKELKVLQTSDFLRKDEEHAAERIKYIVEDFPVLFSVVLEEEISMLALSCDSLTLAISTVNLVSGIYFVDTRCFAIQGPKKPFTRCPLSCSAGSVLLDMSWNPVVPTLMVACTSGGNVDLLEVTDRATVKASLPPSSGSSCVCWSPKGKQLVVGRQDGTLMQYDQNLNQNRKWDLPNSLPESAFSVLDVHWLTNYQFMVAYIPHNAEPDIQPTVILINGSKDAAPVNSCFDDVCYGTGDKRHRKYFMIAIQNWDVLLLASNNAAEIGVVGKHLDDKQKWDHWYFEDSARAECPVTEDCNDSYPKGLAVDFTSQREITIGDNKVHPASPVLIVLTTDGLLIPYHMIYFHPEAPKITVLPERLQPAGVRTEQASLVGQTTGFVQPSAAQTIFGGGLQNLNASAAAGTSATAGAPKSQFGLTAFGSGTASASDTTTSTSGIARPSFGTVQTLSSNIPTTASTTEQSFKQPFSASYNISTTSSVVSGNTTTTTKTPLFGTASTDSSPFSFGSQSNQGFSFVAKMASSAAVPAITVTNTNSGTATSSGTFSFASKFNTGQSFNFTGSTATTKPQAPFTNHGTGVTATATNTAASGVSSPGTFNFISKQGSGQTSGIELTGSNATTKSTLPTPAISGGNISQVFSAKTTTPVIPSVQPSQGQALKPAAAFGASAGLDINSGGTEQHKGGIIIPGNTGSSGVPTPTAGFKFTMPAQAAAVPSTAKPAVTKSPTPVTLGQPIRTSTPVVSEGTASLVQPALVNRSANNVVSTLEAKPSPQTPSNNEINDQVDSHFTNSILEEIQQFQQELKQHKLKTRHSPSNIGTKEEHVHLRKQTEDMQRFCLEVKETLKDQNKEMKDMKIKCLDMFAMMEECRVREQRSSDPKYFQLLKSHALDPGSTDRLEKLRAQFQALDLGIQEVNLVLDMQWEEYQNLKKKSNRIQTPTSDAVYRALKSNRSILQAQKNRLMELEGQLQNLKIYHSPRSNVVITQSPTRLSKQNRGESELSSLADSLLYSDETSQSSVNPKSRPQPDKMAQLREHLSRRSVPIVKSTKPENLSMSRILADEGHMQTTRRNGQPASGYRESRSPQKQQVVTPVISLKQEPGPVGRSLAPHNLFMKSNESSGPPGNSIYSQGSLKHPRVMSAPNKTPSSFTGVHDQVKPNQLPIRPQTQRTQFITGMREVNGIQLENITSPSEEEEEEEDDEEDEDSDDEEEDEDDDEEYQGFGPQYNMSSETKKIIDFGSSKAGFGAATFAGFAPGAGDNTKTKQTVPMPTTVLEENSSNDKDASVLTVSGSVSSGRNLGLGSGQSFGSMSGTPTMVFETEKTKSSDPKTSALGSVITDTKKENIATAPAKPGGSGGSMFAFGSASSIDSGFGFNTTNSTSITRPGTMHSSSKMFGKSSQADGNTFIASAQTGATIQGVQSSGQGGATTQGAPSFPQGGASTQGAHFSMQGGTPIPGVLSSAQVRVITQLSGQGATSQAQSSGQGVFNIQGGENSAQSQTATQGAQSSGQGVVNIQGGENSAQSQTATQGAQSSIQGELTQGTKSSAQGGTMTQGAQSSAPVVASSAPSPGTGVTRNLFGPLATGGKLFGKLSPSAAISTPGTTAPSSAASTTPNVISNESTELGVTAGAGNTASINTTIGFGTFSLSASSVTPLFGKPALAQESTQSSTNPPVASMSVENTDQSASNTAVCNQAILTLLTEDENSEARKQTGNGDSGQVATTSITQGATGFGFKFGSSSGFGQPVFGQAAIGSQASSVKFGQTPMTISTNTTSNTTSTVLSQSGSVAPAGSTNSATTTTTLTNTANGPNAGTTQSMSGTTNSSVLAANSGTETFTKTPFGSASSTGSGFAFGSTSTPSSGLSFGTVNTNSGSSIFGTFAQTKPTFGGMAATTTSNNSQFSQTSTNAGSSLFGQTSSNSPFGSSTATSSTGLLFGQSPSPFGGTSMGGNTGPGLFGQQSTSSSVFGSASSAPSSGGFSFGQQQSGTSSGAFSFSSTGTPSSTGGGGGMFGGGGLFSGLGGKPSEEKAKQNVFGSPQTFSGPSSQASALFGSQSAKTSGSFGSPQTSSSFSNLAFSNQAGGGVGSTGFGLSQQHQTAGGFGSPPRFGGLPSFGSGSAFGSASAFGSSPVFGSQTPSSFGGQSVFGGISGIPQGSTTGGFASFAGGGSPTFGSLAQASDLPSFGGINQSGGSQFGNPPSFGSNVFGSPGFGQSSTGFASQGGSGFGGTSFGSGPSFTGYRS